MNTIEQLKVVMEQMGISQRKLSHLTGLHFNTIWKIFNGKSKPSLEVIEKIVIALGVTLTLGEDDED
jgi:transcriptional regulator with XRE-family HTH domain